VILPWLKVLYDSDGKALSNYFWLGCQLKNQTTKTKIATKQKPKKT
jgi:hypothetical protein